MEVIFVDRKTACKILGVSENANKDDISRTYAMILKKKRQAEMQNDTEGSEQIDYDEIDAAYNYLMGYRTEEEEGEISKKSKISDFIYYNRAKIALMLIFLVAVGYLIWIYTRQKTKYDINIAFVGSIYSFETDTFKEKVEELVPDLKNIYVVTYPISSPAILDVDHQNLQQFQVELSMGELDVIITDKSNFDRDVEQGVFANLDEFLDEIDIDKGLNNDLMKKVEDNGDTETHLYGIDVTDNPIFVDSKIEGNEKIVTIRSNSKNIDNAEKFIRALISSQNQKSEN